MIVKSQEIAKAKYEAGCKLGFSTSIEGSITYGYGVLDDYGFWEFPLRYNYLKPEHKELVDSFMERIKY